MEHFNLIFDLPLGLSLSLVVGCFWLFSLIGFYTVTPLVKKWWSIKLDNNDLNSFYLSGIGVFYGITLGLIAAGTWENYQEVDKRVRRICFNWSPVPRLQ